MNQKTKRTLSEAAGWYGAGAIIIAYALVSFKFIKSDDLFFQFLNLTGAIGVLYESIVRKIKQTAVLNIFWAAIAPIAIVNIVLQ